MLQDRPLSIKCRTCHRQYLTTSIGVHQKACFAKHRYIRLPCNYCHKSLQSDLLLAHEATCLHNTSKSTVASTIPLRPNTKLNSAICIDSNEIRDNKELQALCVGIENKQVAVPDCIDPSIDKRIRCKICMRGFHKSRIDKHESVCIGFTPKTVTRKISGEYKGLKCAHTSLKPHALNQVAANHSNAVVGRKVFRVESLNDSHMVPHKSMFKPKTRSSPSYEPRNISNKFDLITRDIRPGDIQQSRYDRSLSISTATSASHPLATNIHMTKQ